MLSECVVTTLKWPKMCGHSCSSAYLLANLGQLTLCCLLYRAPTKKWFPVVYVKPELVSNLAVSLSFWFGRHSLHGQRSLTISIGHIDHICRRRQPLSRQQATANISHCKVPQMSMWTVFKFYRNILYIQGIYCLHAGHTNFSCTRKKRYLGSCKTAPRPFSAKFWFTSSAYGFSAATSAPSRSPKTCSFLPERVNVGVNHFLSLYGNLSKV